jgi:hypothetical protein
MKGKKRKGILLRMLAKRKFLRSLSRRFTVEELQYNEKIDTKGLSMIRKLICRGEALRSLRKMTARSVYIVIRGSLNIDVHSIAERVLVYACLSTIAYQISL